MPTNPSPSVPSSPDRQPRPAAGRPAGPDAPLADEIRTKRLVICDDDGRERIVAQVSFGIADLRVSLDGRVNQPSAVALVAGHDREFGPVIGLQVFTDGDEVASLKAERDGFGPWKVAYFALDDDEG